MYIGRYQVIKKLGEGGMGTVYHAYDVKLQRDVALKFLLGAVNQKDIKRLQRETQLMATMNHPNVVNVYDRIDDPKNPCIVMELIDGVPLSDFVKNNKMTVKTITQLMIKVTKAMSYIHKLGIVHRDLKLANIMIDNDGEPKIMDFGLAKVADGKSQLSKTGSIIGSVYYMPPEQAQGNLTQIDHRSDIYALGAILYELLTDRKLFAGSSLNVLFQILNENPERPSKIKRSIPRDLEFICLKCLEKKKKNRYQTVADFANDLQLFQQRKPISAKKSHMMKMLKRIAISVVLCIAIMFAFWFFQPPKTTLEVVSSPYDNYSPHRYDISFSCRLTGNVKKVFLQKTSSNVNRCFQLEFVVQNNKLFLSMGKKLPIKSSALLQRDVLLVKSTVEFGLNEFFVKILDNNQKTLEKKWVIDHKPTNKGIFRNDFQRSGKYESQDIDRTPTVKKFPGARRCVPVVVNDVVYYGDQQTFRAVQFKQSKTIWKVELRHKHDNIYTAAWSEGMIFLGVDNSLHCLDAKNGKTKWIYKVEKNNLKDNECIVRFLTVINGIVFFSCHKQFYALDIRDRELLWVKKYKNKIKSPLVASLKYDMIYLCEGHNITTLHCLDILSGEETFQYKLHKIWWASPSLYNDKLYIACFEGGLFIVDLFKNQRKLKFAFNQLELNKKWFKGVDFLAINNKELRLRSFFAMDGAMQYLSVSTHGLLQGFDLDNKKSALWTYNSH